MEHVGLLKWAGISMAVPGHIDVAPHYGSEKEVSMAIRDSGACLQSSLGTACPHSVTAG